MEAKDTNFKRYTITSALPYANGPIHIGHLAGVYVPADIYARYLRMKGKDVLFIGGSDEHGVPITIKHEKKAKHHRKLWIAITKLSKIRLNALAFLSTCIAALRPKFTMKRQQISSQLYTRKVFLSRKAISNIMTQKLGNFWPTAISPALVRIAISRKLMATNANAAAPRLARWI